MIFAQSVSEELFRRKYMINGEQDPDEVFIGVANEVGSAEKTDELRKAWSERYYNLMKAGKLIPGGRILANARPNTKLKQYNNCFVIPIEDSLRGIYEALRQDAIISGQGGGVGFNASTLRPKGAPTSHGGVSSGAVSFLKVFNQSAKVIQTGGGRRAAHIAILNIDHPDIEEFITIKHGDLNKELDQFNISVGITDAFITAVENDADWDLKFEGTVYKTVKARYLMDLLATNAFTHNEPGIFNIDHANEMNTGYWAFKIVSPNPCVIGSTLINTNKGNLPISEIYDRMGRGEDFEALSWNISQETEELQKIEKAFLTKKNAEVIKLIIEEKNVQYEIVCTSNHKLYTKNRGYVEARNLTQEDDIVVR